MIVHTFDVHLTFIQPRRAAYKPTVRMDYLFFKGTQGMLHSQPEESIINIKPSSPATGSTVVGISQSGEWI